MTALKKIGFVGTGIMGSAMAGHLIDAGFELSVYNRTKSKAQSLSDRGARWCDTVGECAAGQDVVITIVGYPKDVEQIYLGAGGIVDSAKAGAYLVDMTTSSPILAEKIFAGRLARLDLQLHCLFRHADLRRHFHFQCGAPSSSLHSPHGLS